eukprot:3612073-Heterocapsa_arctica.AAC.1
MEAGPRMGRGARKRNQTEHQGGKDEEGQKHHEEAGQDEQWTKTSKALIETENKTGKEHEGQDANSDYQNYRA